MRFAKIALFVSILVVSSSFSYADTLNLVFGGTISSVAGSIGNGFAVTNLPDSSQVLPLGAPQVGELDNVVDSPFFSLPAGATITGATLTVIFTPFLASAYTAGSSEDQPVDTSNPGVPAQLQVVVTTQNVFESLIIQHPNPSDGCLLDDPANIIDLIQAGCVSNFSVPTRILTIFSSTTTLSAVLLSPGFNFSQIFDFEGGNSVDVTEDLSISYTPEPSSLVFTGTGILGLFCVARRRFVQVL